MPHSSFFGLIVENGFFAFLIFFFLLTYSIKLNLREKNFYYFSAILFLIIESINMDVHYFKILWIIFPLLFYGNRIKD